MIYYNEKWNTFSRWFGSVWLHVSSHWDVEWAAGTVINREWYAISYSVRCSGYVITRWGYQQCNKNLGYFWGIAAPYLTLIIQSVLIFVRLHSRLGRVWLHKTMICQDVINLLVIFFSIVIKKNIYIAQ